MAKTTKEIKARIAQIEQAMTTKKRGTPEYAQALANLNKQRGLIGLKPLSAKESTEKINNIKPGTTPVGTKPAVTPTSTVPTPNTATPQTPTGASPVTTTPVATPNLGKTMDLEKPVEKIVNAQQNVADLKAQQDVQLGTAGKQINPYGSQTITRDPVTGEITQEVKLSDPQQQILEQGQNLTTQGQQLASQTLSGLQAGFNPETIARTNTGDLAANRARIEEQVFGRLTRGLDEEKANERQQMEQILRNRGIPLGSKQFNDQMAQFDKRYDTRIANARAQAAEMGGAEYSRDFGINEQTIANQISQAQAIKNQNLAEAQAYQGMGTGLMNPEFQGYQGTQYQAPDVLGAIGAKQGETALKIEQQKANTAQQLANRAPSGGSSTPTVKSPFNNTVAQ